MTSDITRELQSSTMLTMGEDEDDEVLDFMCKYCEYKTADIGLLDEHMVSHDEVLLEERLGETNYTLFYPEDHGLYTKSNFASTSIYSPPKRSNAYIDHFEESNASVVSGSESKSNAEFEIVSVCPFCRWTSMSQVDMDRHIKEHSDPLEVPVYTCSECSYTTVRKSDMSKHLLIHVKEDEFSRKYECEQCSYSTIKKWCLQKHKLCHKMPGEVQMHSCTQCPYSTKRKSDLRKHLLIHPNESVDVKPNNFKVYRCNHCAYETIKKWCLLKHQFCHKRPKDTVLFYCDGCTFVTNRRGSFNKHQSVHQKYFKTV